MEDLLLAEVSRFHALGDDRTALIFPPGCNSYIRFRIHQATNKMRRGGSKGYGTTTNRDDEASDLKTFSVGKGTDRRLVLAWAHKVKLTAASGDNGHEQVDNQGDEAAVPVVAAAARDPVTDSKRVNADETGSVETSDEGKRPRRRQQLRPDQAVYVPRQRRNDKDIQARATADDRKGQGCNRSDSAKADDLSFSSTFKTVEEEIAAALDDDVVVVNCNVVVPPSFSVQQSSQPFLYRVAEAGEEEWSDGPALDESLVLEIHDFDPSLKTSDLVRELSDFRGTFDIRWVDDTHALAVFKSSEVAERALLDVGKKKTAKSRLRLRPLREAAEASKERARWLRPPAPPRPRPETSTLVARRMMGGALGVNLISEQRAMEERKKLTKARRNKNRIAGEEN